MHGRVLNLSKPNNDEHPLCEGLVSRWLALPNGRVRTWFDVKGRNHATLTTGSTTYPTWASAQRVPGVSHAPYFDGANSTYAIAGDPADASLELALGCSWGAWFRHDAASNLFKSLVGKSKAGAASGRYAIYFDTDSKIYALAELNSPFSVSASSTNLVQGTGWHHAFATLDASANLSFYIDGISVGSAAGAGAVADTVFVFLIGAYQDYAGTTAASGFWTGLIDDAVFYSRALSAEEVWRLYMDGKTGRYETLNWFSRGAVNTVAAAPRLFPPVCHRSAWHPAYVE